jgi:hypothetical protein
MSNSRQINLAKEVAYAHDIIDMKIHVLAPYNLSYYAVDGSTLHTNIKGLFSEHSKVGRTGRLNYTHFCLSVCHL